MILNTGEKINKVCNDSGACPQEIEGWERFGNGIIEKEHMLYILPEERENTADEPGKKPQTFRIIYSLPFLDHWFEVQGGVGRQVTAGWKSR